MAFLIPENLRTRSDVPSGVNRTARVLQEALDDAATVWYEPLFDLRGERPDIVALVPDVGVVVLAVLEEKAGALTSAADGTLAVRKRAAERVIEAPLSRAAAFAAGLSDALCASGHLAPHERLPVVALGVLPFVARSEAVRKGLDRAMDLDRCLFRDELEQGLAEPEGFRRQLMRLIGGPLRNPLTASAEKAHRAVIHPDTVIGSPQLPFTSATPSDDLKVLDRRQEAFAKGLGDGHRVIRGVAGSGKTLILTYRARLLAEAFPQHKILVTCYNRSLAGMLSRQLRHPNVQVRRIESLMQQVRERGGSPTLRYDRTSLEERADAALQALERHPKLGGGFDHVLVDEAQDFTTNALAFAVRLLRPGSESLLVVADAAQNIYSNTFRWKDAGIKASGRTRVLDASYRNTREILDYANGFLMRDGLLTADASIDDETAIIPPKLSLRSGPLPLFLLLDTPQQEVLHIADHCRSLLDRGVAPSSIGVLYGSRSTAGFGWTDALQGAFRSRDVPFFWATDPQQDRNRDHIGEDETSVVLSTIHSAKGLEFSHVVMCGYLDDRPPAHRILNRRLIYVGMTRATHELVLTASGKHDYIADLEV